MCAAWRGTRERVPRFAPCLREAIGQDAPVLTVAQLWIRARQPGHVASVSMRSPLDESREIGRCGRMDYLPDDHCFRLTQIRRSDSEETGRREKSE
jgi:hypothetical protein